MKVIILCGGAGTRLWPKSRKFWPKFLLSFSDRYTLLQRTFLRAKKIVSDKDVFFICNKEHKYLIKENIVDIQETFYEENLILEPQMKNTLPAIAVFAKFCLEKFGDEVLCVLPSDHYVKKEKVFVDTLKYAGKIAQNGFIVIFGIKPTRIETGYGYIRTEDVRVKIRKFSTCKVKEFIEKPNFDIAKNLVNEKNIFWNSGMFVFKCSTILGEIKRYQPQMFKLLNNWDGNLEKLEFLYNNFESISIDKGVIEKTEKLVFLPLKIFWDDVGSWAALERVYQKDENNNVIIGRNIDLESKNIVVYGSNRLIATAGLKDLVIIDTEDALLVVSKSYAEKVKSLVENNQRYEEFLYHKTTPRPWGKYTVLEHKNGYKLKIINVLPGKRLSLQLHKKRDEQWFIVYGKAKVICGKKVLILRRGDSIVVKRNTPHRLENPSKKNILEIVEIAHGKYISESDIVRLDDDFKRK